VKVSNGDASRPNNHSYENQAFNNAAVAVEVESDREEDLYENEGITRKGIPTDTLLQYIQEAQTNGSTFSEEYKVGVCIVHNEATIDKSLLIRCHTQANAYSCLLLLCIY